MRSVLCAVRPPSDIEEIAEQFEAEEIWKGVTYTLERIPIYKYSDVERGIESAVVYAFTYMTNPQVFLTVERYADHYGVEMSRAAGAEVHVIYKPTGRDFNMSVAGPGYTGMSLPRT